MTPKVLVFAGSLRTASLNKKLARLAAAEAAAAGAEVTHIDLRDYPLPIYDGDIEANEGLPANARKLKDLFIAHQGAVIASPEYNAGITAVLKNTIDWVSRQHGSESGRVPFEGKVVGLCGATPGLMATIRSMDMTRHVLMQVGCLVLPNRVGVPRANDAFDEAGQLRDAGQAAMLRALVAEVVRVAGRLAPP